MEDNENTPKENKPFVLIPNTNTSLGEYAILTNIRSGKIWAIGSIWEIHDKLNTELAKGPIADEIKFISFSTLQDLQLRLVQTYHQRLGEVFKEPL